MEKEEELLRLIDRTEIKIEWPKGSSSFKARAIINIGGLGLIIKGFLIHSDSQEKQFWVTPPQYLVHSKNKSYDIVFIEGTSNFRYFEARVLDEYKKKLNNPS